MKISPTGLEAIKLHEGLRLHVYKDVAGFETIGYGHLIKPGESFKKITEQEAHRILRADVKHAEAAVNRLVKVELSQAQFDALVSFVFNLGAGAFADSTLLQKLNAGDYQGAANELPRWNKAGGKVARGLVVRREYERQQFTGAA